MFAVNFTQNHNIFSASFDSCSVSFLPSPAHLASDGHREGPVTWKLLLKVENVNVFVVLLCIKNVKHDHDDSVQQS